MAEDGSVLIKILGDASEFEKSLNGIAGKGASLIGKGFAAAEGAIVAAGAASVKVGADFESSMSQVAATMGMTTEEIRGGSKDFETLKNAAQQAGETTAFSATESAQALNYLALAGYDAGKAAEVLPSVLNLAAAGGMDLAYASDLVTDSMSALGIEATKSNVDEFGDKMAKTASKANTSVAQLGEATLTVGGTAKDLAGGVTELNTVLGILADNGIKGSEGGTALRNMILSLEAPTDKAAGQLEELGVQVFDSTGKMRSMQDIMADLNKAMANMTSGERTQALNTIFNKVDLKSVNALLGTSTERWNELAGAIDNSTGAMQAMADVQLDNLEGDVTLLQSALEGLGIAVYDHLNEPLRDAVQTITEVVGDMTKAVKGGDFDELFEGISDAIQSIVKLIQKASKVFMKIAPTAVKVIGLIADGMSELLDHVELVTGAVVGLGGAIAAMRIASIVPQITGIIKTLMAGVQTLRVVGLGINGVCGALEVMGMSLTACTGGLGAIAIAAAGAVAAIAAFAIANSDSADEISENVAATDALAESTENLIEDIERSRQARKESIEATETETALAESYAKKLDNLAGKEHKSAYEKQQMKIYTEKLNDLLPDLNAQYDEEADKLSVSTDAIYDNIEAMKLQVRTKAYGDAYAEAIAQQVSLEKQIADAEAQNNKNRVKFMETQYKLADEMRKADEQGMNYVGDLYEYQKAADDAADAYNESRQQLSDLGDQYKKASDDAEYYSQMIEDTTAEEAKAEAIKNLQSVAADAGITIPKTVLDGMQSGKYAVADGVDQLNRLINFDDAIQKAGLQGVDIPESLSQGVCSGEISVKDAIQRLKDVAEFDDMVDKFGVAGLDSTKELRDSLLSGKVSLKQAGKKIGEAAKDGEASVDHKPTGKKSANGLLSGMLSVKPNLKSAGEKLGEAAKSGAGSVSLVGTGKSIGNGLASGIASAVGNVCSAAVNLVTKAVAAAKKKADVNSPSKLMRDQVGLPLAEGLSVGIEQGGKEVNSAAAASVKDAVRSANKEVAKSSIDMSGLIASIPEAKKAISANMSDISMKAKAAVQYEMDRRAASIPAYNIPSAPAYDDERIIALLRDLVAETRNGKTIMVNQRVLGQTVRQWDQKMTRITGGA